MTEEKLARLAELCKRVTSEESHLLNDFVILEHCLTPTETTPNGFYLKALAKHTILLLAEVRRLREALRFYAEGKHWDSHLYQFVCDSGKRAREALEEDHGN